MGREGEKWPKEPDILWLKNYFIKCGGCGIPDFTAKPIFSANLLWHATGTHCILSMISLHSLKALKNVFRLIHNSIKLNYQHISIKSIIVINNFEARQLEFHGVFRWKMTSKSKSWIDSNLKKSFMDESISTKLSGKLRMLLKNNCRKFKGCVTLYLNATPTAFLQYQ